MIPSETKEETEDEMSNSSLIGSKISWLFEFLSFTQLQLWETIVEDKETCEQLASDWSRFCVLSRVPLFHSCYPVEKLEKLWNIWVLLF